LATAEEYPLGVPVDTLSDVTVTAEHHPAFEEYCECIYEMREDNAEVIQARLAERLDVSRASVSEMVKRLESAGLVRVDASRLSLTDTGEALAARIVRRHRLAERFLTDVIGLPWSQAHHEACRWEHVISDDVEAGLVRLLGNPATCPHGNPIPGSPTNAIATTSLSTVAAGTSCTIVRIPEDIEEHETALADLERDHVMPGRRCTVVRHNKADSLIVVHDLTEREVTISEFVRARLLVTL